MFVELDSDLIVADAMDFRFDCESVRAVDSDEAT